jgi:hypothetical protein
MTPLDRGWPGGDNAEKAEKTEGWEAGTCSCDCGVSSVPRKPNKRQSAEVAATP